MDEVKVQFELEDPPEVRAMLVGVQETDSPDDGVVDSERDTLPAKPPRLVSVKVDEALLPDWKPSVDGFAVIEKSTTLMVICIEWETAPLVPVTVTV